MIALKLTRKRTILATVLVIAIGVLATTGWLLWPKPGHEEANNSVVTLLPVDDVFATALGYRDKGNIKGGLEYYDEQINARKDKSEKQQLLLYKSSLAVEAKEYQLAIDAAKQADAINSSASTVSTLAGAYEGKGDKEQAIIYYKKAIELTPKNSMAARSAVAWYQKIEELSR